MNRFVTGGAVRSFLGRRTLSTSQSNIQDVFDVAIIGGGIVGLATAHEILNRNASLKVCIIEKEHEVAVHQSGNNSGVIHAGIYYQPGSYRANLCVEGNSLMYKFCKENHVPYTRDGKLIVATEDDELLHLKKIFDNAKKNGVDVRMVSGKEISDIEPNVEGKQAIFSPNSGCTDFRLVCEKLHNNIVKGNGTVFLSSEVVGVNAQVSPGSPIEIDTRSTLSSLPGGPTSSATSDSAALAGRRVLSKKLVVCAGLHSDTVAKLSGGAEFPTVVPVRGEWRTVKAEYADLVKSLIYPVPNPNYPYLGVHFTKRISGDLWIGPNAVLATAKEGYKLSDFSLPFVKDLVTKQGAWSFLLNNSMEGLNQLAARLSPDFIYASSLRKFIPSFQPHYLSEVVHSGVRALALGEDGALVNDFIFETCDANPNVLLVRNAPSPAATACFAIAQTIVDQMNSSK